MFCIFHFLVHDMLPTMCLSTALMNYFLHFLCLLTLHPCIISQINPTMCTILFNIFIYLFLFSRCFGRPCAHHHEKITVSMRQWHLSLCMGAVWSAGWIETIQPADRTPPTQSDKYQWRIDTAIFSWWWAHGLPKHVEKRNK